MIEQIWHPASEKPKEYGLYLTVLEFANRENRYIGLLNYGKYYYCNFAKYQIGWYKYDSKYGDVDFDECVLCWMELPESTEGEEQ